MAILLALPISSNGGVTATAKSRPTAPKAYRGTWYHYWKKDPTMMKAGLEKIVITKHGFKQSWGNERLKATKHLAIGKVHYRNHVGYTFAPKNAIGNATVYVHTTLKIQGKWHPVLVVMPQGISGPIAYTHFKPGKHQYRASVAFLKSLE